MWILLVVVTVDWRLIDLLLTISDCIRIHLENFQNHWLITKYLPTRYLMTWPQSHLIENPIVLQKIITYQSNLSTDVFLSFFFQKKTFFKNLGQKFHEVFGALHPLVPVHLRVPGLHLTSLDYGKLLHQKNQIKNPNHQVPNVHRQWQPKPT